jgi:hypothetical protein
MLKVEKIDDAFKLIFADVEPNGKAVDGTLETLTVNKLCRSITLGDEAWTLAEAKADAKTGRRDWVFTREGKDNGTAATLRKTIVIEEKKLTIRKEFKKADATDWKMRNEYALSMEP